MEVFRRELDRAVAAKELVVEEKADFGDVIMPSDNEGGL
jgi:hypothetical protein